MPATTKDVLTDQDAVQQQVEEIAIQRNVIRRAFRTVDLTSANSDTVYFVVPQDNPDDIQTIAEGGEFPRDMSDRKKIDCTRDKYGEEYAISLEAERDGYLDDIGIEAENKMNRLARTLDGAAFTVLNNNLNATGPVGAASGSDLKYSDLVDGEKSLMDDDYEPDSIFVGAGGMAHLKKGSEFTMSTELGERTIREGFIGSILGMNVYLSTSGDMGDNEAIMVDTSKYGREGEWQSIDTSTYDEPQTQTTVVQIWSMHGWAATQPGAGIKIQG